MCSTVHYRMHHPAALLAHQRLFILDPFHTSHEGRETAEIQLEVRPWSRCSARRRSSRERRNGDSLRLRVVLFLAPMSVSGAIRKSADADSEYESVIDSFPRSRHYRWSASKLRSSRVARPACTSTVHPLRALQSQLVQRPRHRVEPAAADGTDTT